jgi:hypothetical protein
LIKNFVLDPLSKPCSTNIVTLAHAMVARVPRLTFEELELVLRVRNGDMHLLVDCCLHQGSHDTQFEHFNIIMTWPFWTRRPISNFYEIDAAAASQDVVLWIWRLLACWIRACSYELYTGPIAAVTNAQRLFALPNCCMCAETVYVVCQACQHPSQFCYECGGGFCQCRCEPSVFRRVSLSRRVRRYNLQHLTNVSHSGRATASSCYR